MSNMKVEDYKVGDKVIHEGQLTTVIELCPDIVNGVVIDGIGCGIACEPENVQLATKENLIKYYKGEISTRKIEIKEFELKIKDLKQEIV